MPTSGPWPKVVQTLSPGVPSKEKRWNPVATRFTKCLLCSWLTRSDACFAGGGWWPWASYRGSLDHALDQMWLLKGRLSRPHVQGSDMSPPYLIAPFPCIFPERFSPISIREGGGWGKRDALFQFVYCSKASVTLLCCAGKLGISYS